MFVENEEVFYEYFIDCNVFCKEFRSMLIELWDVIDKLFGLLEVRVEVIVFESVVKKKRKKGRIFL